MVPRFFTDRHTLFVLSLGLLVVFTFGCASAPSQPGAPPSVDVTGIWAGSWMRGAEGGPVTMRLQQTESRVAESSAVNVTGDIVVTGYPQNSGPLHGIVSGNTFEYSSPGGAGARVIVKANEMWGSTKFGNNLYLKRQ